MRRTQGLRYAALRKAQQAKRERDAKRLRRERQVEAALADFFEHTARAEAIEQATAAKIHAMSAAAVAATGQERINAAVAVRAMLDLGETRTTVAELTGLTLPAVRDLLGAADPPAGVAVGGAAEEVVVSPVTDGVPRQHGARDETDTAGYDPPTQLVDAPAARAAEVTGDAPTYSSPAAARWPDPPDRDRPDPPDQDRPDWTRPGGPGNGWVT